VTYPADLIYSLKIQTETLPDIPGTLDTSLMGTYNLSIKACGIKYIMLGAK
jgi:hypothetical protein